MAQEIRLYTAQELRERIIVMLTPEQSHYLANVMRCKAGDYINLFNGKDGLWKSEVASIDKKSISILPVTQIRLQAASPDLWLIFSPIKNKTEIVVEKATELGVSKILPIVTRHAVVRSVNMEKLAIHAISAAEQCERLDIPVFETYKDLSYLLGAWQADRILLYGDETGNGVSLAKALRTVERNQKVAILIGPEGGFAADELTILRACNFTRAFGMGPRILRADTAAIASLACVQAELGDWDEQPHFIGKH